MPGHLAPRKELTGKLFDNPILERLTRTTIIPPILIHVAISSFLLGYGLMEKGLSLTTCLILFICGGFFWTLMEYVVHRFLYHTETNSKTLYSIQHSGHGIHHQHPNDPSRFAMPPVPGIVLSGMFFLIFFLVMGRYALAFFPGFMAGYLVYISIHYFQHKYIIPKTFFLKALWEHHYQHHFVNPYTAYGVSTRLWDFIFGTMPAKRKSFIQESK